MAARGLEFQRTVGVQHGVRIECDFSAADGLQSRHARSLQARRRSKLQVAACARTRQLKLVVWTAAPAPRLRAGRTPGPPPSVHEGRAGGRVGEAPSSDRRSGPGQHERIRPGQPGHHACGWVAMRSHVRACVEQSAVHAACGRHDGARPLLHVTRGEPEAADAHGTKGYIKFSQVYVDFSSQAWCLHCAT